MHWLQLMHSDAPAVKRGVVKVPGEIALGLHHADVGPARGLLED